ncbi:hypothetical protein, partial [Roseateles paludis]
WRRSGTSRQLSLKPTTIVNALVRPRPSDLNQRASAIPGALHRRVFPVDVQLDPLLGEQRLQPFRELVVTVAMAEECRLLQAGTDLRLEKRSPLTGPQ